MGGYDEEGGKDWTTRRNRHLKTTCPRPMPCCLLYRYIYNMEYFVGAVLPYICNAKTLTLACYALVALVHVLALWTQHVFMWNSRFNCKGSGCLNESSTTAELLIECAVLYLLIALMLLSYWRCILTPAGSPPPAFQVLPQPPASPLLQTAVDVQLVEMTSGVPGHRR